MSSEFESVLKETQIRLESRRQELLAKKRQVQMPCLYIFISMLVVLGIACIIGVPGLVIGSLIIMVVTIIVFLIYGSSYAKEYCSDYKREIHSNLLREFSENLSFSENGGISKEEFKASGLFNNSIDRYKAEDLVSGSLKKTNIRFSEVHAEERRTETTKNGTRTYYVNIFKGIFFVADFNKHFQGSTLVKTDIAERTFGNFGRFFQQSVFKPEKLIQLEDQTFEREFAVYSTNQVEARYILTPRLMERILNLQKKTKGNIQLAFRNSSVFIAIEESKNLFEPDFNLPATDANQIATIFSDLNFFVNIVDDLDLNTRLWTKE